MPFAWKKLIDIHETSSVKLRIWINMWLGRRIIGNNSVKKCLLFSSPVFGLDAIFSGVCIHLIMILGAELWADIKFWHLL